MLLVLRFSLGVLGALCGEKFLAEYTSKKRATFRAARDIFVAAFAAETFEHRGHTKPHLVIRGELVGADVLKAKKTWSIPPPTGRCKCTDNRIDIIVDSALDRSTERFFRLSGSIVPFGTKIIDISWLLAIITCLP